MNFGGVRQQTSLVFADLANCPLAKVSPGP